MRKDHLLNGNIRSCGCLYHHRNHSVVPPPTYTFNGQDAIGETHDGRVFVVDAEDFDVIKNYAWYFDRYGYVVARIDGRAQKLHRFLLNNPPSIVDHIDRDKRNNRKSNIRIASPEENAINRTISRSNAYGIMGIRCSKNNQKWQARITVNKKQIHLGTFFTRDEAIRARLLAEQKYFGEFAPQKHLFPSYLSTTQEATK